MDASARLDVLVIGSGASGLAAAVAAESSGATVALATKGSIQANNSSKAQGGIQAAFGADDSPDLHSEDVMRSSHETADPRLVEVLTGDAASAIHWLEELGCAFTQGERWLPPGALRRRLAEAAAPDRGSHRACDNEGTAGGARVRRGDQPPEPRTGCARADRMRVACLVRCEGSGHRCDRRGHRRPRGRWAMLRRGGATPRALDESSELRRAR